MPFALRVAVSLALLAFVLSRIEWRETLEALTRADLGWLLLAFAFFNGAMVLASKRWQLIVDAGSSAKTGVTLRSATAATYVSLWLSNFLPTAFGGDIARVVTAQRAGARLPMALSSALLDRYLGLTTLALLFVTFEAAAAMTGNARPWLPAAAAVAAGFCVLLLGAWASSHMALKRQWLRRASVRFVARAMSLLRTLAAQRASSTRVLAASLAATLLGAAAYWGAIRCLDPSIGFPTALAVAAVGTFASALPISLSGWGVREGAVAVALTQSTGLSTGDASLVALLNGIVIGLTSLAGFGVSVAVGRSTGGARGARSVRRAIPQSEREA